MKGVKKCYIWSGHFGEKYLLLRIKPQFLGHPACDECGILAPVAMEYIINVLQLHCTAAPYSAVCIVI